MKQIELVDLKKQYEEVREEVIAQIEQVLSGMKLFLGENVYGLEEEFAEFCGTRYAVGVGSGTDALYLALRALGVGLGDEVITVSHTFIATAEAIMLCGARPVFVDIDSSTYTIDVSQIDSAITSRTRAIVPVHLYGHPADLDPILRIAQQYALPVVEDACQAHGARYKGEPVGSFGAAAAFSFYCAKNLGAYGEGGIVVTRDRSIATRVQMMRSHGEKERYHHVLTGLNSRLDEIQAAVLRVKLPRLHRWNAARRTWAEEYNRRLADLDEVVTPREEMFATHVYHLYVIRVPDQEGMRKWLKNHGVSTGVHYPIPVHLQEACQDLGYSPGCLPRTEAIVKEIVSLPMYPELTLDEISYVCQTIRDYIRGRRRRRVRPHASPVGGGMT